MNSGVKILPQHIVSQLWPTSGTIGFVRAHPIVKLSFDPLCRDCGAWVVSSDP